MGKIQLNLVEPITSRIDRDLLRQIIGELNHSNLALPEGKINLKLVDDATQQALNKQYSGNDYATDVLSFSYIENDGDPIDGVIGEMTVSLETAARQADHAGITLAEEVAILVLHGVLHIAGHDHQTPTDRLKIDHLQAKFAAGVGIKYKDFEWTS